MPDLELSVTICSWNTAAQLRKCLLALQAARDEARFEVLVVDNNSQDESPDMVERDFPWVRLFRMSRNLGFTGGHNYAMERRLAPHVFPLNSDAYVHPGCLRKVLDFAASNPKIGIIGPKLLNPDGSLAEALMTFKLNSINLTKIQSIPIIGKPTEYSIHIDVEWKRRKSYDEAMKQVLRQVKNLNILGEYKKAKIEY